MYRIELSWPVVALGALTLPMVPWVGALLAVVVVLIAAVAILVALVGAIVTVPFLVVRAVRRHRRSGDAMPAHTAEATVGRASLLTAAGRQVAAPKAPAVLAR